MRTVRFRICNRGWNDQLDLRTGIEFTPNRQFPAHESGPFVEPAETDVSGAPPTTKSLLIDAFPVVHYPQSKLAAVIPDFHFDKRRLCMSEGIAQRLGCNTVDIVPDQRSEFPWGAFDMHAKLGTILLGLIGGELFRESADRP